MTELQVIAPVSVVIPCFCCADTIERALTSVLNQTQRPKEVILVEDCSPDEGSTLRKLRELQLKYGPQVDIVVIALEENCGAGEARNAGWECATQEYLSFLDADDSWHCEKIEIQYKWMQRHPGYVFSCHQTTRNSTLHAANFSKVLCPHKDVDALGTLFSNAIPTRSVMLRRQLADRFPQGFRYAEDYYLWLQILFKGGRAAKIDIPLAFSYKDDFEGAGLSANLKQTHLGILRSHRMLLRQGSISKVLFFMAGLSELVKYRKRVLFVFIKMTLTWTSRCLGVCTRLV